jgi:hypothetical protein
VGLDIHSVIKLPNRLYSNLMEYAANEDAETRLCISRAGFKEPVFFSCNLALPSTDAFLKFQRRSFSFP